MEIQAIRKRDGSIQPFDITKITNAIAKALAETGEGDRVAAEKVAEVAHRKIVAMCVQAGTAEPDSPLARKCIDGHPAVEEMQDLVEAALMETGFFETAKAYIIYRNERKKLRERDIFTKRTNLKPYEYPELYEYVSAIRHSYWVHTEFNFTSDVQDFHVNVNDSERNVIKNAMLAIAQVEVNVKSFWGDIYKKLPKAEIGAVGATFAESEVRHTDAYAHLLELLGLNNEFAKIKDIPVLRERVAYLDKINALSKTDENRQYASAVILFSLFTEHVSLFSQFLIMMSFNKHRNIFKGISNAVEATSKEEQIHGMFGIDVVNIIKDEHPEWFDKEMEATLIAACEEAYQAEAKVIDWIYEAGELEFLPSTNVKEFVKHRFNNSLVAIGLPRIFDVSEALLEETDWFDNEVIATKHNDFFNKRSINYNKRSASVTSADLFLIITHNDITAMEPWYWLNENSRTFLARGYLAEGQTAEERIAVIAKAAETYLKRPGFADKFTEYMSKGWISLASPVWSNFGVARGLPISCFGSYVDDNMSNILFTNAEVGMMSKYGGGCSGYFGAVRGRGAAISGDNGYSSGSVHFMQLFETLVDVVSQGSVRRGHFSPYLPVEHPDIMEFLDIGTEGNPIQKLTHAVTVGDEWMEAMIAGDEQKRKIWARVIQRRGEMGYPYIMFSDNANKHTVDVYKDKGLRIYASNMCSEIMLPSKPDWSFVCCLSSVNLLHYHAWKDTDLIETMIAFLDAVMEDFIVKLEHLRDHAEPEKRQGFVFMERAYNFAKANRALGLGVLGWHSLLQANQLAFESPEAMTLNKEVFAFMQDRADAATKQLATELGEPEILKGYGRRNTTTIAIAPTTSSAFILGQVSQGIEPIWSNCYVKDVAKMKVTIKNPNLKELLATKDKDTKEVWDSIRDADGSVQHLDCLSDNEKAVYRTFAEIDQAVVITQAADRQVYIDQGQSLNVMVAPDTPVKDINQLYIEAWKQGVKALYYQHSMNAAQQMVRKKMAEKNTK